MFLSILIAENKVQQNPVLDLSFHAQDPITLHYKITPLENIPSEIWDLTHLETLILSHHNLKHIPKDIHQKLPLLQRLVLHNNPLVELPDIPGLDLDWWQYDKFHHQLSNEHIVGLTGATAKNEYLEQQIFFKETEEDTIQELEQFIPRIANIGFPNLKYLQFHSFNYPLRRLSNEIGQLQSLEELDLSYHKLESLPESFKKLKALKKLWLRANNFNQVHHQILELPQLELLDLAENLIAKPQFKYPPGMMQHIFQLKELNLSSNGLIRLPSNFEKFKALEVLQLCNFRDHRAGLEFTDKQSFKGQVSNPITGFLDQQVESMYQQFKSPGNALKEFLAEKENQSVDQTLDKIWPQISQLPKLKVLDLSRNEITAESIRFEEFKQLEQLDLSHNQLQGLPKDFGQLHALKHLDLSYNRFDRFPEPVLQLAQLHRLILKSTFNSKIQLPESWAQLSQLETLDLSDNALSDSDFILGLSQLPQLKHLHLSSNNIQRIPSKISGFQQLHYLFLQNNQLSLLPEKVTALTKLQILDLSYNQINQLPEEFKEMQSLRYLFLQQNELEWLPEGLCHLGQLRTLNLMSNKLTGLPSSIDQLKTLEELNLEDNYLRKIPIKISYLPKLKVLNLKSCSLRKIPAAFFRMEQIETLNLQNNALISPPMEIIRKGATAILQYFEELELQKSDYLHEAKLLIVGSPGAGKTTLRLKLLDSQSPLPSAQDSTEGVDIEQLLFPLDEHKKFRMNIWDFGGQELYHSTHQFFFTHRSLYALVLNTRRDDDRIDYWLHTIQLFGGDSPVIIIQNEEKDRTYALNEQRYRSQYPNIKEFVQLNLSNPNKIPALVRKIQFYIQDLPHVGDELPLHWLDIRQQLSEIAQQKAYISLAEFRSICVEYELTEENKILLLSNYLHDLGTILHFQDNPILKHLIFLQNSWVIDAVYRVLDNDLVKNQQHGRFSEEDLHQIWNNPEYIQVKFELLELMLKFELCFQVPDQSQYIVPQLLPPHPPQYDFNSDNVLNIEYRYDFMPRGLMTRFVVQMHTYIKDQDLIWKEGVILERLNTVAIVTEDYDQRLIKIQMTGERRQEMLAILSDEFDRLHASYPQQLKVRKMIPCNCSECRQSTQPHLYDYRKLRKYLSKNRESIVCDKSFEDVQIKGLLEGIQNPLLDQNNQQLQILFLAANPKNTQALNLDHEVELLREVIETGRQQNRIRIDQRWEVSYDKLQQSILKTAAQLVHFSGHGLEQGLILENSDGLAQIANTDTLAGLFAPLKDQIFCVILNACYSEHQAAVIAQHIPFVVGMNAAVSDKAAMLFTKGFYRGLANRLDIEFAFEMGRNLVHSERPKQVDIFVLWKYGKLR